MFASYIRPANKSQTVAPWPQLARLALFANTRTRGRARSSPVAWSKRAITVGDNLCYGFLFMAHDYGTPF